MGEGERRKSPNNNPGPRIAHLVFAAIACLLPFWIAAGIRAYQVHQSEYRSVGERASNRASAVAAALDHELSGLQTALSVLGTSPAFVSGDFATVHRQAVKLTKLFPESDIIVADRSGQQILNSFRPFGARLPERAIPETVQRVFQEGKPVVSKLFFGAVTRRPLASVDVPVTIDGVVRYDIAMTVPVERLGGLLLDQNLPAKWVGTMLDGDGTVVARTIDSERFVGSVTSDGIRRAVSENKEGLFEDISFDGQALLIAFKRSDISDWSAAVAVPIAVIKARTNREIVAAFAIPALCTLAAFLLVLMLTKRSGQDEPDPDSSTRQETEIVGFPESPADHKQIETELKRYSEIVETVGDHLAFIDRDFRFQFVNGPYARMFLTTPEAMWGQPVESIVGKSIFELALPYLRAALNGEPQNQVFERRLPDARQRIFDTEYRPFRTGETITGIVVRLQDITERVAFEREQKIAAVAFETQEGIAVTDAEGTVMRVNKAFTTITGFPADEVVGRKPTMLFGKMADADFKGHFRNNLIRDGIWRGDVWNFRKSGEEYPLSLNLTAVTDADGNHSHYVVVFQDITERKAAEERMRNLAFYDILTGLPNRLLIQERLRQARISCDRNNRCAALMFIDLDNFKTLNDTYGHDAGDRLLIEVSRRLERCVRQLDTVGRLGGDEFIILLENIGDDPKTAETHSLKVANKVMDTLCRGYDLSGFEFVSTPSIGLTLFCGSQHSAEEILRRADQAMYQAKSAGRRTIRLYSDAQGQPDLEEADWP